LPLERLYLFEINPLKTLVLADVVDKHGCSLALQASSGQPILHIYLQPDPVLEATYKLKGEQGTQQRQILTVNKVLHNLDGLAQLIVSSQSQ